MNVVSTSPMTLGQVQPTGNLFDWLDSDTIVPTIPNSLVLVTLGFMAVLYAGATGRRR